MPRRPAALFGLLAFLLFLSASAHSADSALHPWRACAGDLSILPYLSGDDSDRGVTEKLMIEAGRQAGLAVQLVHFPYRRCRLMFDAGEVDALIVAPTEANQRELQFPLLKGGGVDGSRRLARLNLVWVRRPEATLDWDGKRLLNADPKTLTVGTRNTLRVGVNAVQALGYRVDEGAISTRQALNKLKAGRVDVVLGLEEEVQAALREPALHQLVQLPRAFSTGEYHAVTHKDLPPEQQLRVEVWWDAIGRLRDTPAFKP